MDIQLKNIKPTYMSEAELAASDIYLQEKVILKKGEKYLIKANSGHGKSSILNFIYGSNLNYDGSITYNEEYDTIFNLRRTKLSYVFQDFKLFPDLTVFENIQLKNKLTNYKTAKEIDCLIAEVLLEHKRDSLVKNLSLGQRQRVAIIRALCQPFDFLLLDEPFSHLDSTNINILITILNKELDDRKAGIIVTALEEINYFKFNRVIKL
jgi:putative ABC transport system ATP-binding protein